MRYAPFIFEGALQEYVLNIIDHQNKPYKKKDTMVKKGSWAKFLGENTDTHINLEYCSAKKQVKVSNFDGYAFKSEETEKIFSGKGYSLYINMENSMIYTSLNNKLAYFRVDS